MNDISQDEVITCFIFSDKHFARTSGTVKFRVFMPPLISKDPPRYSTDVSVCRISAMSNSGVLPEDKVWEIGLKYVQNPDRPDRMIKARADILVNDVWKNNLKVIPDPEPYKEHANITPFPPDRLGCQMLATELALASQLVMLPKET
ncbi:hypothetical protein F4Y93_01100 [Candidatus Poribacteria bacterium]|nr:hypothetical protein [Candidatus Poribacteria bacterium]